MLPIIVAAVLLGLCCIILVVALALLRYKCRRSQHMEMTEVPLDDDVTSQNEARVDHAASESHFDLVSRDSDTPATPHTADLDSQQQSARTNSVNATESVHPTDEYGVIAVVPPTGDYVSAPDLAPSYDKPMSGATPPVYDCVSDLPPSNDKVQSFSNVPSHYNVVTNMPGIYIEADPMRRSPSSSDSDSASTAATSDFSRE